MLNGWVPLEGNIIMPTFGRSSLVPLKRCLHRLWAKYPISTSGAAIADPLSLKMMVRVRIYSTLQSRYSSVERTLHHHRRQSADFAYKREMRRAKGRSLSYCFPLSLQQPATVSEWGKNTSLFSFTHSFVGSVILNWWFAAQKWAAGLFWCFNANVGFFITIFRSSWIFLKSKYILTVTLIVHLAKKNKKMESYILKIIENV